MEFTGKAIKLGDDINTDLLAPGRWLSAGLDSVRLHSMEAVRPDFYKQVEAGDILVGGRNFGCGSHREQASSVLRVLGFSVVVCDSIARLYFRNCISMGIPAVAVDGVSGIVKEGDRVKVILDPKEVAIINLDTGESLQGPPLPSLAMELLERGGFIELMKAGSPGVKRSGGPSA